MRSYILLPDSAVVVIGTKRYNIHVTSPTYPQVISAIRAGDWDALPELLDVARLIERQSDAELTVKDNQVYYNGKPIHNILTQRIIAMLRDGFNVEPMLLLLKNLMANPTTTAIDEFFLFIEMNQLPITEDGCILAYKQVTYDFYDYHSCSVFNKPYSLMTDEEKNCLPKFGANQTKTEIVNEQTVVSMSRSDVDDNRSHTCSYGLHFCSLYYLGHYFQGGRTLIVKVNPSDIISIPHDYENTKGRCCKYTIVGVLDAEDGVFQKKTIDDEKVTLVEAYNDVAVVSAIVDRDVHLAYNLGYSDGKLHNEFVVPAGFVHVANVYAQGYKDGKGKQKRKYPRIS